MTPAEAFNEIIRLADQHGLALKKDDQTILVGTPEAIELRDLNFMAVIDMNKKTVSRISVNGQC